MTAKESRVALVFGSLGHSATHLLILLHATVVLVLESEFAMSYADLLQWLSVPGFVLVGAGALPATPDSNRSLNILGRTTVVP